MEIAELRHPEEKTVVGSAIRAAGPQQSDLPTPNDTRLGDEISFNSIRRPVPFAPADSHGLQNRDNASSLSRGNFSRQAR